MTQNNPKSYNWHKEYYCSIDREIMEHLKTKNISDCTGWLYFIETYYPEVYAKYIAVEENLNKLWNQMDDVSIYNFKELCKQYKKTIIWGIETFIEAIHNKESETKSSV